MNELQTSNMKTPIEIALGVDENGMTTARALYDFLELAQGQFSRWAKTNIEQNEFYEENKDWWGFDIVSNGNNCRDYRLTTDFAKHLSMESHSARGKEARQYFITIEDRAKQEVINRSQLSPQMQMVMSLAESMARQELEQKKIVLNITAKYNSREQGELKPAGIPSVKGFDSKDIGKLTTPLVTEEDVKVNNDYATSLGAIATVMGSISQMTNEGASAWLTWSANLMTAIGTAIPAIEALIAAKKAESIGNAVASATQTPVVGWLLAGAAVASVIAAFATMPQFANGGVVDGSSFFGDKVLARVNSGEMILNKSQQSNLFNLLDGGSSVKGGAMSGEVEFKISDKALVGVLKQHNNRINRLT